MKPIEIDFKINEKVFFIKLEKTPDEKECPTCLGEGLLVRLNSTKIKCPTCHGKKTISESGSLKNVVKSGKLERMNFEIGLDGEYKTYTVETKNGGIFRTNAVFKTKELAQKECDEISKGVIMGYST
jgi:DnaJ-class molecular chaperone